MRCEIPEFERACFCLPLRKGILLFGYLSLIYNVIELLSVILFSSYNSLYHGVSIHYVSDGVALTVYCVEILFNIVLLVGAHMKQEQLIRYFYYYGVSSALATLLVFLVALSDIISNLTDFVIESCFFFSGFVLQVYLLLLVRSEFLKLNEEIKGRLRFDRRSTDHQFYINTIS